MPITQLDPKTALVVIDLQKGIVAMPTAQPVSEIVALAAALAQAFRAKGLPVVLVNVAGVAPGRTEAGLRKFAFPPDWTELAPELDQQPGDILVTKHRWGAFIGTGLDETLRGLGVTQIVLAGVATSVGVESTARSAYDAGYNLALVTDAMTDRDADAHRPAASGPCASWWPRCANSSSNSTATSGSRAKSPTTAPRPPAISTSRSRTPTPNCRRALSPPGMLLRFRPEDGLHVLVRGRVSVYEQRGQMQLVAETMEPVGAGSLQLAFEQLKERLKAEGLFDADRKHPLPAFHAPSASSPRPPARSSATSSTSWPPPLRPECAAGPCVRPGRPGPAEIEANHLLNAIARGSTRGSLVDLIVLARGGGSLEDLAAFNSERVARAIAASHLPVVSAIGHETDFTIADFAADLRAPTPSAAAELITEAQHKIAEHLASNRTASPAPSAFSFCRPASASPACPSRDPKCACPRCCIAAPSASTTWPFAWKPPSPHSSASGSATSPSSAPPCFTTIPRQALPRPATPSACRLQRIFIAPWSAPSARTPHARRSGRAPALALAARRSRSRLRAGAGRRRETVRSAAQLAPATLTTRLADGAFTSRVESTSPPPARPHALQSRIEIMTATATRKLFGTDGIRAVAGESPLDPTTIYAVGLALGHSCARRRGACRPARPRHPRVQPLDRRHARRRPARRRRAR
jgi:nicotinamidase-related amidase